jgi:hypothetical protein
MDLVSGFNIYGLKPVILTGIVRLPNQAEQVVFGFGLRPNTMGGVCGDGEVEGKI